MRFFRRFSTFRRRLARVVPRAMLRVPFLGTLPVGVTPPRLRSRRVCKEFSTQYTTPSVVFVGGTEIKWDFISSLHYARLRNPIVSKFTVLVELEVFYPTVTSLSATDFRFRRYSAANFQKPDFLRSNISVMVKVSG